MREFLTGSAIALFGLSLFFWIIPVGTSAPYSTGNLAYSPAFWPRVLAAFLVVGGTLLAVKALPIMQKNGELVMPSSSAACGAPWRFWASIGLLVPYYLTCVKFGLVVPSMIAFIIYGLLAGERSCVVLLLAGILMPFVLTLFFIHIADILVPVGPASWLMR